MNSDFAEIVAYVVLALLATALLATFLPLPRGF